MRSPAAVAGALVFVFGAAVAVAASSAFENAAEIIIHIALGVSFALFARSAFDFGLPRWIAVAAFAAIGVLAGIFLLQGVAYLAPSVPLRRLAYDILGQRFEKILGYAFLLWCVALFAIGSTGKTRVLGAVVLAVIIAAEIYGLAISRAGGGSLERLKLLYIPLVLWLLLEGVKPPRPATFRVF
jgi:hypothetical protein